MDVPVLGLVPRVRHGDEVVALDGVVGERPPREVLPHVEGRQLDLGGGAEVAGEQRQPDVVAAGEGLEQRADTGQQAAASVARLLDLLAQRDAIRLAESIEPVLVDVDGSAGVGQRVPHDDAVGAAGQVDLLQRVLESMGLGKGARHRARAGAAGEDQRPVDIEQQQSHTVS